MRVLNLIGQPGAGKSTLAAGVFWLLKTRHHNVELVTEYTKDAIYEGSGFVLEDELLLFAEKYRRIKRLSGSVEIAITDSPLMNAVFYDRTFGPEGRAFFRRVAEGFDNLYVFVRRVAPYVPHARMGSQAEADRMAEVIRSFLVEEGIPFFEVEGDMAAPAKVVDWLEASGALEPRLL
jgi:ABC-type cobalamin/Fe3+-siderophores transport system ATPase subunit